MALVGQRTHGTHTQGHTVDVPGSSAARTADQKHHEERHNPAHYKLPQSMFLIISFNLAKLLVGNN